jgi:calcineurin-like phosphoesterase family protein
MKYSKRPGLTEEEQRLLEIEEQWAVEDSQMQKDGKKPPYRNRFKPCAESTARMDKYLIDNINQMVGPDDILWHLGDFCFGSGFTSGASHKTNDNSNARKYRNSIKCKNMHAIWGNHDNYSIRNCFSSASDMHTLHWQGQDMVLCHYAMAVWNRSHRGAWHLYGHSHSNAESWLDRVMPGRKSMDVGVDNVNILFGSYRPLAFEEIKNIMSKRIGCSIDHHIN